MSKNVVVILPNDKLDHVAVADDLTSVTFTDEKHARLSLPIEEYVLDGKTYHFARWDADVPEHKVEKAIRNYY
ncbi:MAG: hypothetical protein ACRDCA_25370 [Serratia sp. (in: enterobacteria)]|uniref:hypothetical protein n=1 Tax=Serratia sp. (in: enterobacteria) TaxID=616 RepID=UPI003F39AB55